MTRMDRNLTPGPSSFAIRRAGFIGFSVPLSLALLALLLMQLGAGASWFTNILIWTMSATGIGCMFCWPWSESKERKEVRAGYTTWPRLHQELEQRDPYLGKVIRRPGQAFLKWSEFRAICKESRAAARTSSSERTPSLPR